MRVAVRQRYPETGKELKVIRTYEQYSEFEAEITDLSHFNKTEPGITRRTQELVNESTRIIEALKRKPAVKIPVVKGEEKIRDEAENGKGPLNASRPRRDSPKTP